MKLQPTDPLTIEDRQSHCWRHVKEYVGARIQDLRDQLECDHPTEHTAKLRGQIKSLRKLLNDLEPPESGRQVRQHVNTKTRKRGNTDG